MAAPIVRIKRSSQAGKIPTNSQLLLGELAINTTDGKVYIEQERGGVGVGTTVIAVNPWNVGLGGDAYDINFTAGDVGVGTDNPTQKLDVDGNLRVTGAYYDSSNDSGTSGYVLKSTATGTDWVDPTTVSGLQGTTGTQGTQGTQGTHGITGAQGTQGITGATGAQGTQGIQGVTGSQGTTGTQGTTGAQGTQGIQGVTGAQGTAGDGGTDGTDGAQGTQGIQGVIGSQGTTGTQGTTGAQGTQGIQGVTGSQGTTGTQGTQGIQGVTGVTGAQGTQGLTGSQGVQGTEGNFGGATFHYTFSTNTTNSAPAMGYLKFSESPFSGALNLYIDRKSTRL